MRIETKYNLNDSVWIMKDNKCYNFNIEDIKIEITQVPTCINYGIDVNTRIQYKDYHNNWYYESDLYPTKEELINTL